MCTVVNSIWGVGGDRWMEGVMVTGNRGIWGVWGDQRRKGQLVGCSGTWEVLGTVWVRGGTGITRRR